MKIRQSAVLSATGAGASLSFNENGFLPQTNVPCIIASPGGAFVGSAIVQSSVDGTTWVTATGATAVTAGGTSIQMITPAQFMRLNVTAFTSGNIQATFLGDVD